MNLNSGDIIRFDNPFSQFTVHNKNSTVYLGSFNNTNHWLVVNVEHSYTSILIQLMPLNKMTTELLFVEGTYELWHNSVVILHSAN